MVRGILRPVLSSLANPWRRPQAALSQANPSIARQSVRTVVYSHSGAVLECPEQVRFGLIKVLMVVVPFITLGATISKSGAAFLEENDIFVPDDEDD